jgi:predicted nucleotidyltransferase
MTLAEPIAVTLAVVRQLDELGIRYLVGGSLASSVHGIPRSTQDIDLLVELPGSKIDDLVKRLEPTFYVDRDMIADAVRRRSSFNIIDLKTMFKVDLFVSDRSPLLQEEMGRRQAATSERQWQDIVGVLTTRRASLDRDYLERWCAELGLLPLFERALAETGFATR